MVRILVMCMTWELDNQYATLLQSSHIYLAELLEGNKKEITKYLISEEDAWNWKPYFDFQVIFISVIIQFYSFYLGNT